MSSQPLLGGHVDDRDDIIEGLREKNRRLDEALRLERLKVGQSEAGVKELRRVLTPLYRALQTVFGEIEAMGIQDSGSGATASPKLEIWERWKSKMGGQCSRIIDALLAHGTMSRTQLCIATGIDGGNIAKPISKLYTAGLLNKNGSEYSLKQL